MNFPVSIKGVLVEAGSVMLLENERDEWELPGGRLEPGEAPETCLVREFAEELGAGVEVARIIDCWLHEVLPQREVVIFARSAPRLTPTVRRPNVLPARADQPTIGVEMPPRPMTAKPRV